MVWVSTSSLTSTVAAAECFIAFGQRLLCNAIDMLTNFARRVDGGMQVERERDPRSGWTPEAIC